MYKAHEAYGVLLGTFLSFTSAFTIAEEQVLVGNQPVELQTIAGHDRLQEYKGAISLDLRTVAGSGKERARELSVADVRLVVRDFSHGQLVHEDSGKVKSADRKTLVFTMRSQHQVVLRWHEERGKYAGVIPIQTVLPGHLHPTKVDSSDYTEQLLIQPAWLLIEISIREWPTGFDAKAKRPVAVAVRAVLSADEITRIIQSYFIILPFVSMEMQMARLEDFTPIKVLCLQPIFFKSSASDTSPSGAGGNSLAIGLPSARGLWGQQGILRKGYRLDVREPIVIESAQMKSLDNIDGRDDADAFPTVFPDYDSNSCAELIFVQNFKPDRCRSGGGFTRERGAFDTYAFISDEALASGNARNLVAHEIGHLLGLGHPPPPPSSYFSAPGTVMCAAGCDVLNPGKNARHNIDTAPCPLCTFELAPAFPAADCDAFDCGECSLE